MRAVKFGIVMAAAAVLLLGAMSASAESINPSIPHFSDGRVNAYDLTAPLAVYCHFNYPDASDVNKGVLDSIEVWGFEGRSIRQQLWVDAETIDAVGVNMNGEQQIAAHNGYALNRTADGGFSVTGANYRFEWDRGAQGC